MATHSSILAWKIPCTENPGGFHGVAKSQTRLTSWTHTYTRVTVLTQGSEKQENHSLLSCVCNVDGLFSAPTSGYTCGWIPPNNCSCHLRYANNISLLSSPRFIWGTLLFWWPTQNHASLRVMLLCNLLLDVGWTCHCFQQFKKRSVPSLGLKNRLCSDNNQIYQNLYSGKPETIRKSPHLVVFWEMAYSKEKFFPSMT